MDRAGPRDGLLRRRESAREERARWQELRLLGIGRRSSVYSPGDSPACILCVPCPEPVVDDRIRETGGCRRALQPSWPPDGQPGGSSGERSAPRPATRYRAAQLSRSCGAAVLNFFHLRLGR
ncbi:hypothetical protein mRhiFer1_008853 [Rhinolophus ferrumequinum]|uniref:Uncharacterized protein n=1 Tax=Rhinolophus ferrumequinum TaxID=59479 RepID=A0A7J8AF04_RHIFE|nr:hypothetical protein mRhiFer1_008853 [Rhinolophus ferrumequinum]